MVTATVLILYLSKAWIFRLLTEKNLLVTGQTGCSAWLETCTYNSIKILEEAVVTTTGSDSDGRSPIVKSAYPQLCICSHVIDNELHRAAQSTTVLYQRAHDQLLQCVRPTRHVRPSTRNKRSWWVCTFHTVKSQTYRKGPPGEFCWTVAIDRSFSICSPNRWHSETQSPHRGDLAAVMRRRTAAICYVSHVPL